MKAVIATAIATIATLIAANASADYKTVACYVGTDNMSISFDTDNTIVSFNTTMGSFTDSFLLSPQSDFDKAHSYVTIVDNGASIKFDSNMISGDLETPLFLGSAAAEVTKQADGQYILTSVLVYNNGQLENLQEFVNNPCYVQ